jgi:hypothetical protein
MCDDLDLDELIAQSGDFFGRAVPRDSATATEVSCGLAQSIRSAVEDRPWTRVD